MKEDETIINLCDRWSDEFNVFISYKNKILIGSYTCGNYFIYLAEYIVREGIKLPIYDLVIPILSEHELIYLENDNVELLVENADRIVVNDFGLLNKYKNKRIRLGRLIFKDYRDQRYEEYDHSRYCLKSKTLIVTLKKMGFLVEEIESDLITREFELYKDIGIKIYIHFPYRQVSCSHICEFSGIGKTISNKFKPDDICNKECRDVMIKTDNPQYLKIGKSVYNELNDDYLVYLSDDIKLILTPRWLI